MKTKNTTPVVIEAAVKLLESFCPEISPASLVEALKAYTPGEKMQKNEDRPLTRAQAAELLQVSHNTISTYLKIGKLKKIPLTARSCRIDAASVRALLSGTPAVEK